MSKSFKKKPNYILIIGIVLLAGIISWNLYSSWLVSQLALTTTSKGWVKHEKVVQTVFANTETIITTPTDGKVIILGEEGTRYKKGDTVAKIVPTGIDQGQAVEEIPIKAPISGLFYQKRDNLEHILTPENLMNMDLEALLAQVKSTARPILDQDGLNKNAPLGKMVNNLYPSWMFVYLEAEAQLSKGDTVKFRIEDNEYTGTVMKISGQPSGAVVRFSQYVNNTTENRIQEGVWCYKPATKGTLVPVDSLYTLGEERGVYLNDEGFIRFQNVKVLDQNEFLACVEGLPEGVEVITNPREGIDGMTVKKKI